MESIKLNLSDFSSPKRKRYPPAVSTIPPTPPTSSPPPDASLTNLRVPRLGPNTAQNEEAHGSPRTTVAHNFQGLQLAERDEVAQFKLDMPKLSRDDYRDAMQDEDPHREEEVVRKRVKLLKQRRDRRTEIPETPHVKAREETSHNDGIRETAIGKEGEFAIVIGPLKKDVDWEKSEAAALKNLVDPVIFKGSRVTKFKGSGIGDLKRAYPSINRLADSKSRSKKRSSTPPLSALLISDVRLEDGDDSEPRIVDPERAALTWHDDEITGHDPDDPDDDGEGINGIGFKPTSAEAYARSQKRRQQMAEYKNREAREARKNRIERRRHSDRGEVGEEAEAEKARRVRFMEAGTESVMLIDG